LPSNHVLRANMSVSHVGQPSLPVCIISFGIKDVPLS
jgi:hypothetical protein